MKTIEEVNALALANGRDPAIIPAGEYCYSVTSGWKKKDDGTPFFETQICPYWTMHPDREHQESGYCAFLGAGDWEENGTMLLWDQVKECAENREDTD